MNEADSARAKEINQTLQLLRRYIRKRRRVTFQDAKDGEFVLALNEELCELERKNNAPMRSDETTP